jgi:hypothetical protein
MVEKTKGMTLDTMAMSVETMNLTMAVPVPSLSYPLTDVVIVSKEHQ